MTGQLCRSFRNDRIWLIAISLIFGLVGCRNAPAPPPTEIPLDSRVSQLQASRPMLTAGEATDIRVGVVKVLGSEEPFEYQWATTGGVIAYGQGTCCVTYQAPETPGTYQVQLMVKYNNQLIQRSLSLTVIAPTSTPEPTPTSGPPTNTPPPTEVPLASAAAYFERAQTHYFRRDYERTIADYTKAIELNYNPLSEPYYNRGYVYYITQEYSQAIADFSKAIELDYEPISLAYYNRGNAYYYKGDNDQAIVDYTQAITLEHEPLSWVYNNRGLVYRKKGQYEQAIADYTKAIELKHEPLNWPYYNRANAYADQGAYDKAIVDYNEALRLDPTSVDAYYQRGLAYRQLGDTNQAMADFKKVIEMGNDFWRQEAERQLLELGAE